jgi:hypothetical protein
MKLKLRFLLYLVTGIVLTLSWMAGVSAQEATDETVPPADETSVDAPTMTDEQLEVLMTSVDRFFIDQDIADLTVDLDVYRDPANRLNSDNIKESNPGTIAGLCTIVSHYMYTFPEFYKLTVLGETLAGSDLPADQTFYSQILPLPGAPIYTESIRERFTVKYIGDDEVENIPVYKVKYTAKDRDKEFFNSITYYIGKDIPRILRMESSFDNTYYKGNADGNFYYDKWLGKYLPIYGHGSMFFQPNKRYNVWGRWRNWDWKSAEEVAQTSTSQTEGI